MMMITPLKTQLIQNCSQLFSSVSIGLGNASTSQHPAMVLLDDLESRKKSKRHKHKKRKYEVGEIRDPVSIVEMNEELRVGIYTYHINLLGSKSRFC